MALTDRDLRKLANTKQSSIEFHGKPSVHGMLDGQIAIEKQSNSQLALYRKKYGKLWKSYMSSDGNQYVDRILTTNTLKYTNKFIDYRVFHHNFSDDLPSSKIYVPWEMAIEQTALLDEFSSFLTPYRMTCHKIFFRPPAIDTAATDIVFGIEKIDSGDTTVDSVCTFDAQDDWVDNTNFIINQSDWTAPPIVDVGDLVGISIQADNTNIVTSAKIFSMTSVWRVEIII
jgi:hypothetical protein